MGTLQSNLNYLSNKLESSIRHWEPESTQVIGENYLTEDDKILAEIEKDLDNIPQQTFSPNYAPEITKPETPSRKVPVRQISNSSIKSISQKFEEAVRQKSLDKTDSSISPGRQRSIENYEPSLNGTRQKSIENYEPEVQDPRYNYPTEPYQPQQYEQEETYDQYQPEPAEEYQPYQEPEYQTDGQSHYQEPEQSPYQEEYVPPERQAQDEVFQPTYETSNVDPQQFQPAQRPYEPAQYAPEPQYRQQEPQYSEPEVQYRTKEPQYLPQEPQYRTSEEPQYRPQEPQYRTSEPQYRPQEPQYRTEEPQYRPQEPQYSQPELQYPQQEPQSIQQEPQYPQQYEEQRGNENYDFYKSKPETEVPPVIESPNISKRVSGKPQKTELPIEQVKPKKSPQRQWPETKQVSRKMASQK